MTHEEIRERRNKIYREGMSERLIRASQARCPIHDAALAGFSATCPVDGCEWQYQRTVELNRQMAQSQQGLGEGLNNIRASAQSPEPISYLEADRNIYRDKWRATQGIRGALRNLARQVWR